MISAQLRQVVGTKITLLVFSGIFVTIAGTLNAESAIWNLNPVTDEWGLSTNWTPAVVPYGETALATFGPSNITDITVSSSDQGESQVILGGITFAPGAGPYTLTVINSEYQFLPFMEFHGAGITNNSGMVQNLVAATFGLIDPSRIYFMGNSSVGENVVITNEGSSTPNTCRCGAFTELGFYPEDQPNAGTATFINNGSSVSGTLDGGGTELTSSANAESATFVNNPGTVAGAAAGSTFIQLYPPGGHLGTSTFIANPATVPGAEGGWVEMDTGICESTSFIANGASLAGCQAGQIYFYGAEYHTGNGVAIFTGNGGNGSGAEGGLIDLFALPRSDQTVVIANPGTNGGFGGNIVIEANPLLDLGQFQVFGNGILDLSNATGTIVIGSLSGSGMVLLAGHSLSVGNNNLSTTFSGVIQEGGTLIKAGTGALTLSGANTQSGGTTINAGVLVASNRSGSATGTGNVNVKAGTLGGKGTISGPVTIGAGSGSGAFLAPSVASNQPATLTLKKTLTFKSDSTCTCKLNTRNARADQVVAKEVTIESGAQLSLQAVGNKKLTNGTVFTVISNTATTPISGNFANLADNSILTAGRNNYQASYEGGDGNDLTLTVVP